MAKPENDENHPEKQTWSTWEELILACAVHRHGIDSWDSVAAEIQKQNSSYHTLTAFDCRHKYHDLKRRFSRKLVSAEGETVSEISYWLEELRKLRVDELRREVERYDLSISSLQMKVKRLEDEREKSLKEADKKTETKTSDLDKIGETIDNHRKSGNSSDVPVIEPPISSDPDNCPGTGSDNTPHDRKIVESVEEKGNQIGGDDNDEKPAREDSCRGSCESVAKDSDRAVPEKEGTDSPGPELGEEEAKETSDVQSSASLPRKETVEHDQPDNENQSLAVNNTPIESRPLIDFIEILQSHPIGSHFSRRLESQLQETPEYERIIRQHIDFKLIRTRVDEGYYERSKNKFFRDLLLLVNNVKVFYGDRSSEFNSANQLNELIKKQMSKQTSPPKEESLVTSKEEVTVSSPPLSLKPELSLSIKACRKRSSLAVRLSEPFKKKTKTVPTIDDKPVSEAEEEENETDDKDDEPIVPKKMHKGRTTSAAKGSRNIRTSLDDGLPSKGRSSNDSSDQKKSDQEKKGSNTSGGSKKQSAASFLKRMKGSSAAETVLETGKADSSNGKRGAEQKKSNSKLDKADAGKSSAGQKRTTGKKPAIEKASPAKKNTSAASKREASEKETGSSARPKKCTRRL